MANRTRDIIRLREAARLCRARIAASGNGADEYGRLAVEIDGLIQSLTAEAAARQVRAAAGLALR